MGASAAETVKEIEETRTRLDSEVKELERRLPAAPVLKRVAYTLAGGGMGGTAFWFVAKRLRGRRKAKQEEEAAKAVASVASLAPTLQRLVKDEETKGWLIIAGGIWVVLRMIEIRQLRKQTTMLRVRGASVV